MVLYPNAFRPSCGPSTLSLSYADRRTPIVPAIILSTTTQSFRKAQATNGQKRPTSPKGGSGSDISLGKGGKTGDTVADKDQRKEEQRYQHLTSRSMSAFNAFFAQLTGGGTSSSSARDGTGSEKQSRDGGTAGPGSGAGVSEVAGNLSGRHGKGSGSVGAGSRNRDRGSSSSDVFGVSLNGTVVKYDPKSDRRRFGIPQVRRVGQVE